MEAFDLFFVFLWLLCGVLAALVSLPKGEPVSGFVMGTLLGPFGIRIASRFRATLVSCPQCDRPIHCQALICPFCRLDDPWKRH